ncbi:hypothetical protein D3C78_1893480 [compost metagenome]
MEDFTFFIAIEHAQARQLPFFAVVGFVVVDERASGNLLITGADLEVFVERSAMG